MLTITINIANDNGTEIDYDLQADATNGKITITDGVDTCSLTAIMTELREVIKFELR